MKLKFFLILPWFPKELNPNFSGHWAVKARAKKAYKTECLYLCVGLRGKITWPGDIHLFIDFWPPDKRKRDDDNCLAAIKSGLDGLADAMGVNDCRFKCHPFLKDEVYKNGKIEIKIRMGPE